MVPLGLRIACRRASCPTSRSPLSVYATTDGVVRAPSALGMTRASPPSQTAITELVVPRSIPTALAMTHSGPGGRDRPCGDVRPRLHLMTHARTAGAARPMGVVMGPYGVESSPLRWRRHDPRGSNTLQGVDLPGRGSTGAIPVHKARRRREGPAVVASLLDAEFPDAALD